MQTKSHLYIDFSGDLGFKLNRGSTKYVAFAMIQLADLVAGVVREGKIAFFLGDFAVGERRGV